MKTLIIALNSKYTHTALSVWYLKANCHAHDCEVMEFSINEPLHDIYCAIMRHKPELAAFSCYIWNITHIIKLCEMIKKAMPEIKIALGGPEVSYTAAEIMEQHSFIDYIIMGEGEHAFAALLNGDETAQGIVYRRNGQIQKNGSYQLIKDLGSLHSPFTKEMLARTKDKTMYFEASRGCPFSCSYCLSSTFDGVRYFPLNDVKESLMTLCSAGIKQIKFVDRTFNCSKQRAMEIISFILEHTKDVQFHFEIAADLLDDELIRLLLLAPKGKIQLEIGVQTVNEQALMAANRKTNIAKVLKNVTELRMADNIHLHLDLIAGLPHEDFASFMHSFDTVYHTRPHQLQLGFLKLLKGSLIRESKQHAFQYASFAPYEIISNQYMTADELIKIKRVEDVLDRYYNSGRFTKTLEYLATEPFSFYKQLSDDIDFISPPSVDMLHQALLDFIRDRSDKMLISDLMKLDFLSSTRFGKLPDCLSRKIEPDFKQKCFDYLKDTEKVIPAKEKYKTVHFEPFDYDLTVSPYQKKDTVLLFDYKEQDPVSKRYSYKRVSE